MLKKLLPTKKQKIGRLEKISFPEFGVENIDAKVDTGAYTGCIHANVLGEVSRDGRTFLQFRLLDETHPEFNDNVYETDDFKKKKVKSSNGIVQERYMIMQKVIFAGTEAEFELGLDNRDTMKFPVLIGRKNLTERFIVDVEKEFTKK